MPIPTLWEPKGRWLVNAGLRTFLVFRALVQRRHRTVFRQLNADAAAAGDRVFCATPH